MLKEKFKIIEKIKEKFIKERVSQCKKEYIEEELFYLECNLSEAEYVYRLYLTLKKNNEKVKNIRNSSLYYVLGMSEDKPKEGGIDRTPTTMPDIDYDTDGRDEIKEYLVNKYGQEHTTLIGTYGSLKTKGAVKDVLRMLKPQMSFEEVNELTKKFEVVKRTDSEVIQTTLIESGKDYSWIGDDYSSEIAYFFACLEADKSLGSWFDQPDNELVKNAIINILGNVKSTGIHAGGIIVSRAVIPDIAPLSFSIDDGMYITQPEMAYVEESGLIKYDFLGLKTLGDLNRCIKLVNDRHGKKYTLSNVPMNDEAIFKLFVDGKTESVFQFNTDLAVSIITKLKEIRGIEDLAMITSIARPGPLAMGMHTIYIERNNERSPIEYIHPSLEKILKETYGIICYQEQIIIIAKEIGRLDSDSAVDFMKALSKKKLDKVQKYVDKLIKNAINEYGYTKEQAETLYKTLEAFAAYGFNKSHAVAYSCVSYLCMWFKTYYTAEWISAVLSGADKEDFKILYPKWKDYIQKPDINLSKLVYTITSDSKVIMPVSHINDVGETVSKLIIENQPYKDFSDFNLRVKKANKKVTLALIWSGAFDSFKPHAHYPEGKWRKELAVNFYSILLKKAPKKDRDSIVDEINLINKETRGQIMMKEISLLNFTSFDYHAYYYKQMTEDAFRLFGKEAVTPDKIKDMENGQVVVVGGGVEKIDFITIKSGKNKGKTMARIKLSNEGQSCDITIFPKTLEEDDKAGSRIRKIKEQMPLVIKGKVNIWNGMTSVVYDISWNLLAKPND